MALVQGQPGLAEYSMKVKCAPLCYRSTSGTKSSAVIGFNVEWIYQSLLRCPIAGKQKGISARSLIVQTAELRSGTNSQGIVRARPLFCSRTAGYI